MKKAIIILLAGLIYISFFTYGISNANAGYYHNRLHEYIETNILDNSAFWFDKYGDEFEIGYQTKSVNGMLPIECEVIINNELVVHTFSVKYYENLNNWWGNYCISYFNGFAAYECEKEVYRFNPYHIDKVDDSYISLADMIHGKSLPVYWASYENGVDDDICLAIVKNDFSKTGLTNITIGKENKPIEYTVQIENNMISIMSYYPYTRLLYSNGQLIGIMEYNNQNSKMAVKYIFFDEKRYSKAQIYTYCFLDTRLKDLVDDKDPFVLISFRNSSNFIFSRKKEYSLNEYEILYPYNKVAEDIKEELRNRIIEIS